MTDNQSDRAPAAALRCHRHGRGPLGESRADGGRLRRMAADASALLARSQFPGTRQGKVSHGGQ